MKWNTNLYDQEHDFVSKYGEDVIALLAPQKDEYILDLGCGTGDLAAIISNKGATVIGVDNSPEMIASAKNKYPAIRFEIGSADDLGYATAFDAVFSNATLHWVLEYEKAIQCIYHSLKPGGRFVAEFGGKGNVAHIIRALQSALVGNGYAALAAKKVWYFPALSEYSSLLEKQGFRVVFATHFDRSTLLKGATGIRNWLHMFGQPYLQTLPAAAIDAVLNTVEEQIRPTNFRNGSWYADYVRLRIVAIKQ
ncbi:class I SAM-dependent methyltransferase [Flavihumibacter profundi]|uniref:class I SAM-dependent methyltransferase n=1 Tax=Flavihumibacter profundi TaxID=2716883 RepID=UPI001CC6B578|nr:class I SAM-dependent methyltransferase [Flavihumibacter profundi]MBZ5857614.1 methyltransferase domain-containing protein [Flavihumibacter profundi]